jgi:hypothetical protein
MGVDFIRGNGKLLEKSLEKRRTNERSCSGWVMEQDGAEVVVKAQNIILDKKAGARSCSVL